MNTFEGYKYNKNINCKIINFAKIKKLHHECQSAANKEVLIAAAAALTTGFATFIGHVEIKETIRI